MKMLLLWLVPVAVLLLAGGLVADLAGFFTLAALVTFGGAYAVLPFVATAAVDRFGWLTADDMVAGLALGESTPGPLIMVNTFVGFVAGYNVEGGLAWGLLGATIATLCTFVPSFVFIVSGAPIIDRIRTTGAFAASLNGITIGVVGVIAGLAVFVARHAPTGTPTGWSSSSPSSCSSQSGASGSASSRSWCSARRSASWPLSSTAREQLVAPGVEVADEAGEPVLELHAPAVRPSVVDDEDAEISECALQHATAAVPGRARAGNRRAGRPRARCGCG